MYIYIYIYIYTREPSCNARRRTPSCIAQPYKAKVLRSMTFSLGRSQISNMRIHTASEVPAISLQPLSELRELSSLSSRVVSPDLISSHTVSPLLNSPAVFSQSWHPCEWCMRRVFWHGILPRGAL